MREMSQTHLTWQRLQAEVASLPESLTVLHRAGDLVFQEGAFAPGVSLVTEGLVVLGGQTSGAPRPVALARPGDLLGLEAWGDDQPPRYRGFARALTDTMLLFAPTHAWTRALERPAFRSLVLATLADLVLSEQTLALRRDRPEHAVAWALLRWGLKDERDKDCLHLPVPPATLAQVLGLTRTTLRQAVAQLADLGIVEAVNGHLVGSAPRLREILGEPVTASAR